LGRGTIQLFGRPGFAAASLVLEGDAASLARSDFDDRASSIVVTRGTWELCSEPDFRGDCRTYPPGRYADPRLPAWPARSRRPRLVRPLRDAPVVIFGRPAGPGDGRRRECCSRARPEGQSLAVAGPVMTSRDRTSTRARRCRRVGHTGSCAAITTSAADMPTFGPGRYDDTVAHNFLRQVSSTRAGGGVAPPPASRAQRAGIELFSDPVRGDRCDRRPTPT
jgi:hypothetical protein